MDDRGTDLGTPTPRDPAPAPVGKPSDTTVRLAAAVTPAQLWQAHRAALGGHSAVTGAPLPATLDECPAGVQASHYGIACYLAVRGGQAVHEVPIPGGVDAARAEALRERMVELAR